jgi:hypothetical protein
MDESSSPPPAAAAHLDAGRLAVSRVELHELALFGVATLAAWVHTVDEIRIGQLVAVPFGIANAALLAAWPSLRDVWRGWASVAFGLFWALLVIPYHVLPLFGGAPTGRDVSGLTRVVGGGAMTAVGIVILRRARRNR